MSAASPFDVSLPELPPLLLTTGEQERPAVGGVFALIERMEEAWSGMEAYAAQVAEAMAQARAHLANSDSEPQLARAIEKLLAAERKISEHAKPLFPKLDRSQDSADAKPGKLMKSLSDMIDGFREALVSILEDFRDTRLVLEARRAELINAKAGGGAAVEIGSDQDLDDYFDRFRA